MSRDRWARHLWLRRIATLLLLVAMCCGLWIPRSSVAMPTDRQIQAAFLYHLLKFVQWPDVARKEGPWIICIVGGDPFGSALAAVQTRTAMDRAILVRVVDTGPLEQCHVVYLAHGTRSQRSDTLRSLSGLPILTVTDSRSSLDDGAIVRFAKQGNTVKLQVNNSHARRAGLTLSSHLLRVSDVVER